MYRIKECVDDFEYKFNDPETGKAKNLMEVYSYINKY